MTDPTLTVDSLAKIAEGREAEMFEWGDGRVLRLFRPGFSADAAVRQMNALQQAAGAGVPVPAVFGLETLGGRPGVIMERLRGPDLLTMLGSKPWRVFSVAAQCGQVHARINAVPAPPELGTNHTRFKGILARLSETVIPTAYAEAAIAGLDHLPEGDRLCHGDFHPANVMTRNGEPVVIDWSNAVRGPAEADFARARLVITIGEPPPGTSAVLGFLARYFRRIFLALYSRAYRKAIGVDESILESWELPVAVVRLAEQIPEERAALLRYIGARMADR